ncbi:MATE family efflux transporter [Thermosediminibacter oceani]|uniref:Multidrug export protein MepA n=1 Tax=Thermosediminibacter oceani (strain ATCC BAA-1034 / DSM 16646 / JW/IW-1228P) TaxID=555079 RepID=D9S361_THEOJ|nr:MATE family efflux transporter [Thermosediminibacter oceani]ADL07838.1 MATE efflux family protein [Thermosediminibacter oceani DSM 16646]
MYSKMTADEKFRIMTQEPVNRLICSLAVPTIISMLISAIYNMTDTFFISKISTSASGAVGISFSLMAIIQALGFTIGMGSGNYISRLLGQKKREYASNVAATVFFTALFLGAVLTFLGLIFLDPLVYALGATPTIAPYARSYIRYILIGAPYMMASFVLNNILRFQGSAFFAMLGIATGSILNIVLDPIFIFVFKMGTGGAALATIISQFISFCILYYNSRIGGNIRIKFKNFTPKWEIYREILKGGLPSFIRQILGSTSMICMNFSARPYGDAAIAAMAIVARIFQFAMSAVIGFGQGFQPVCGFNYGARRYDRVLNAFWFCVRTAAVFLTSVAVFGFMFSYQIISIFRKEDLEVINIGIRALRFQCLTFPLSSWIIMTNMLLQTIGKGFQASVVSASRQGLFFIPAVIILPRLFGLLGVQISQSVSDVFSFLLAVPMALGTLRELEALHNEEKRRSHATHLAST